MLICLDAGHSLVTAGKRIPANIAATVGNMHEWEFNSSVANKVATMLNAYENITTFRSDDITGKTDINVNTRASNINKKNPALIISIHANAGGGTGCETYVWNATCKTAFAKANIFQKNLVADTGLRNRGVKYGNFAIIRDTYPDAVLMECAFMDTLSDAKLLVTDAFRTTVATSIVKSLVEIYGIKLKYVAPVIVTPPAVVEPVVEQPIVETPIVVTPEVIVPETEPIVVVEEDNSLLAKIIKILIYILELFKKK